MGGPRTSGTSLRTNLEMSSKKSPPNQDVPVEEFEELNVKDEERENAAGQENADGQMYDAIQGNTAEQCNDPPVNETDSYVHIDLSDFLTDQQINEEERERRQTEATQARKKVATTINSFMLNAMAFDPRGNLTNFPARKENLDKMRIDQGISKERYEMWKIRKGFNWSGFLYELRGTSKNFTIKIILIEGNNHQKHIIQINQPPTTTTNTT